MQNKYSTLVLQLYKTYLLHNYTDKYQTFILFRAKVHNEYGVNGTVCEILVYMYTADWAITH